MAGNLYPRYINILIDEALADTPVICLLGPRQSGKSTLARTLEPERLYISFDDAALIKQVKNDPAGFVQGLPERVTLDEIQRIPELMLSIKASVDENRKPGRFILTGSANLLLLPAVQESLAGRMEVIYLDPLSEQEKHFNENALLECIINDQIKPTVSAQKPNLEAVAKAVVRGGFPEPNTRTENRAKIWHKQYVKSIIERDVKDIAMIRDEIELERLLDILALRTGNLLNVSRLSKDLGMQRETIEKYITILERLFLIRRLPAWHKNQSKRLIKAPKIHVVDSGLASSLCNLKTTDWFNLAKEFGGVLESFVVQQLICQAGWVERDLRFSHYRDKDQVEVDLVIEQGQSIWGVEVKKATSIQNKDGIGLSRLAAIAGESWRGGILLYTGSHCLPLNNVKNSYAVPMHWLWSLGLEQQDDKH